MPALPYSIDGRYLEPVKLLGHRVIAAFVVIFAMLPTLAAQQLSVAPSPLALTNELQKRINDAAQSRQLASPEDVARATKRVITLALAEMAEIRSIQGSLPASIALYRQALAYEDSPAAHFWLALTYNAAGHPDGALHETAAVLFADPKNANAWNLQGKLFMQKQQYREAAESLEHSLTLHTDMEVAYTMATAYLQMKERDKAANVFRQMEQLSNNSAGMHIMAARAYDGAGIVDEAEKEYKAAIAADAKGSHAHYFLGLFYLTRNQWESTPQIVAEFQQEVALNPKDFFGNYFLGYLASAAKDYDASDKYLAIAASAKPDWPEPYLYMGLNAYGRGTDAQAEPLLRKAIALTGTDEARNDYQVRRAYFTLGRILIRKGQNDEGTRDVERSREMETHLVIKARQQQALDTKDAGGASTLGLPTASITPVPLDSVADPSAFVDASTLAAAHLDAGTQSRIAATEKQLRLILGSAFNDLGTSSARQRDFESAFQQFQNAERWNPSTENLARNLGMAAYLSGHHPEAIRALRTVVAAQPQDQRAQKLLALSLASNGDYAPAVTAFDGLGDDATADPEVAYRWALSLARTNQRERSIATLKKLSTSTVAPELLLKACKLYSDLGDTLDAQSCFTRAKIQGSSQAQPH
jgi:tetratricopeptide (TPR) repeat protein